MARSKSSTRWLRRQEADPYVQSARHQGLASRAAFKLQQIDQRDRLLRPGMLVVDLGAAPGGWSQYAAARIGPVGKVVAVDLLPMDVPAGIEYIQGDFTQNACHDALLTALQGRPADLVISDMAPNITGIRSSDQARAMYLAELALELAREVLGAEGGFLVKLFQGEGFDNFVRETRNVFARVAVRKPEASRAESREVYLLTRGFRD